MCIRTYFNFRLMILLLNFEQKFANSDGFLPWTYLKGAVSRGTSASLDTLYHLSPPANFVT